MSIEIAGYRFEGPYESTSDLENRSGVYSILTPTGNSRYKIIDVGESATVRTRVEGHDRKSCWRRNANNGQIRYAAYYTPGLQQAGRKKIEQKIREQYNPPCGDQ